MAHLLHSVLVLVLVGCGSAPPDALRGDESPRPTGVPGPLRVLSAGVEGEYPVDAGPHPNLTLHLVDGDAASAWRPTGVARLEIAASDLTAMEIAQQGVRALRWRPLWAEGSELVPGEWAEIDLEQVATVGGVGPWQRFTARSERPVRGVEVEVTEAVAEPSVGELRLIGHRAVPDDASRSTRWVAVTSSTADGPFQRAAEQVDAVDPARCSVWIDGQVRRGTDVCDVDDESATLGTRAPGEAQDTVRHFRIRPIGSCFALIDGYPYTRCAAPDAGELEAEAAARAQAEE